MYPISYEADPALEGRNRLTTFFRYFLIIPWHIVAGLYGIVAFFAAVIAWFAIVFTGRYPQGLYDFNAGYLRMVTRVNGFYYLLDDAWPPFGGNEDPGYPVRWVPAPWTIREDRTGDSSSASRSDPGIVWGLVLGVVSFIAGSHSVHRQAVGRAVHRWNASAIWRGCRPSCSPRTGLLVGKCTAPLARSGEAAPEP
jgi:hypothetical protein